MKLWKSAAFAAVIFLSIASTVTYTSCLHDSCKAIICRNDGVCVDGFCNCPVGYEGTQCEIVSRQKFVGKYYGITKIDNKPVIRDSATVDIPPPGMVASQVNTYLYFFIGSRQPVDSTLGQINAEGDEVIIPDSENKSSVLKWIGEDKIEILIDEVVDGEHVITNFSGTKSE